MAKTPAERQRRYRERQKRGGFKTLRVNLSPYGYSLLRMLEAEHHIHRSRLIEPALLALAQHWARQPP